MQATTTFRRRTAAGIASIGLLIAACNAGAGSTQPPAATQSAASAGASGEASGSAVAYEVDLASTSTLSKFLTGEDGKTLYAFMPDTSSKSACTGDCPATWPPFTLEGEETVKGGAGVTGTFATIARDDGSKQVTYNGHPLYYYSADSAAGDTNGQGLFSKWYVVGADGNAIMGSPSSTSKGKY